MSPLTSSTVNTLAESIRTSRASRRLLAIVLAVTLIGQAAPGAAADHAAGLAAAREHLQKGRLDEALEAYDELAKDGADAPLVAIGRSRCFEARGDWKEATEALAAAAASDERTAPLHARLAEVHLLQGQYEGCMESLDKALAIDADDPLARLVQADLWAATGQFKLADEAYRWFVRYYNKVQPTDPDVLLVVAHGSAQYARWHSVTQVFDFVINTLCPDMLAADKNYWQAQWLSGQLLLEKYNRAQAMPELRKALAINPRAADVQAALAGAAQQDHALAEADQLAARALEINPRHRVALLIRSDVRLEDGDFAEARKLAEAVLAVNRYDEPALARLAACELLEAAPPPQAELDELLSNLDNPAEASIESPSPFSKLVTALVTINPRPGVFLKELGERLEARKKFELAERFYRQAVASMPQLASAKTSLGLLYMRVGRNHEAAQILDDAFAADPYHVRVSNMRKVLKVLDGYRTIETDHFLIRVDGQADEILGRYMAEYLEEVYPGLVEQFRFEPSAKTQFEIFNKAKGLSAHQWFSARMVGLPWVQTIGASTGMMVALASPTATDKPFNWARVLKHEFVHILTLQQTQFNIPHWYTEALAVTAEGFPRPESWNRLLLERVAAGNLMNLDTVNLGFIRPRTPDDWTMAYCQSRLYAQYMTEKFGADTTARLLEAYRQNLSTDEAVPQVCKVSKAEFEKGYRQYLNEIVAGLKGTLPEPPITLAEAEKAHRKDPDDAHAAGRYALELLKINRRKEARKLAEAVLKKTPSEPLAAIVMAQLEIRAEDLPVAAQWLTPALDRQRPHPQVLDLLSEIRLKLEQYDDARELYELGLVHDPDHVAWLRGLATAMIKGQQTGRLKEVLEKLVETDSDEAAPRVRLAKMALAENDFESAIRYGRLALYVDVLDVETHRVLAQAYAAKQQLDKAVDEWRVAVQLKPADAANVVELARAEAAAGKKPEAVKRLDELLESKPDFAPAQALRDELK